MFRASLARLEMTMSEHGPFPHSHSLLSATRRMTASCPGDELDSDVNSTILREPAIQHGN